MNSNSSGKERDRLDRPNTTLVQEALAIAVVFGIAAILINLLPKDEGEFFSYQLPSVVVAVFCAHVANSLGWITGNHTWLKRNGLSLVGPAVVFFSVLFTLLGPRELASATSSQLTRRVGELESQVRAIYTEFPQFKSSQ